MPTNEIYATLNVTQPERVSRLFKVLVKDKDGNDFTELGTGTFFGVLRNVKTDEEVDFAVSVAPDAGNVLVLAFPALEAGRWLYEVWVSVEGGTRDRLVCGLYSTVKTVTQRGVSDAVTPYDATLVLGYDAEVLTAYFNATSRAELAAERAVAALDEVRESVSLLQGAKWIIDSLAQGVQEAFTIGANEHWYVGGQDTGRPSRGAAGLDADAIQYHSIASVDDLPTDAEHCNGHHRYITYVQARPAEFNVKVRWNGLHMPDGVRFRLAGQDFDLRDGEDVQQAFLNAFASVGHSNDFTTYDSIWILVYNEARDESVIGGTIYAVNPGSESNQFAPISLSPNLKVVVRPGFDDGYGCFVWTDGQWTLIPLFSDVIASRYQHGAVRLSTDSVVRDDECLSIGVNSAGQIVTQLIKNSLLIPDATTDAAGKVRLAKTVDSYPGDVVTASLLKQYLDERLTALKNEMAGTYLRKDALRIVDAVPVPPEQGVYYFVKE